MSDKPPGNTLGAIAKHFQGSIEIGWASDPLRRAAFESSPVAMIYIIL